MNKKVNYYCFPTIKKEKWLNGAKTKYDIPQYIEGIPEGFAIFCTTKEAGKVRKYQERIERKNKMKEIHEAKKNVNNNDINREVEDMDVINKRIIVGAINNIEKKDETKEENNMEIEKEDEDIEENNSINDELQEPLPREDHRYCYICKTKFEKYVKHIRSHTHFENLYRHKNLFSRIRKSFEKIINFWEINGRKRKIKKYEKSKNIILNAKKSEEIYKKDGNYQNKKFNVLNNIISNIDLNKNYKFKNEKFLSDKSDVHPIFNRIILNKNGNNEHIINLTINKNINENIIINNTINNNNNSIKTINYINISNKDEERTIKTFNDKKIHIFKDEKSQPRFVTQCFPKFSTLQMQSLSKPKKRKKADLFKAGGDIFVISTPKKIDIDYFPMLKMESPKKLINKSILFFK